VLFDYRDYLAVGDLRALTRAWQHLASLEQPMSITAIWRPQRPIWDRLPKTFFSRAPRLSFQNMQPASFVESHSRAFSRFRKLERLGLKLKTYSGDCNIVRQIYERRARQSLPGELFHDRRRIEFMVAICREERSRCEVFTLEHGGTLAAALVTFRDDGYRRFYTTYYDRAWARYSPGVSLLFEVSRQSLEQGLSFDLMTGEQAYKKRIATDAQDLFEVKATPQQLSESLPAIATIEHAA
ncbi:MAG TPA: GNAT family N-acetyltransferase, partial [Terriglobales bacterium]|nr:GNAT family N-acetyltransferase [Terriglobales bacterium]